MAEFKKIRRLTKRSTIPGQVPTIPPPGVDHDSGLWSTTDIYEGEFFLNLPDEKLYTREGNSIILLLKGFAEENWFDTIVDVRLTSFADDDVIGCFENRTIYKYDETSTSADDGNNVLKPTSVTGSGRWLKIVKMADDEELIESGDLSCKLQNINDSVIYVVFDTSSLSPTAVTHLWNNVVNPWFNDYQANNPEWSGTLKRYDISNENWLQWAGIAYNERLDSSYTGNVILIAFIDESNSTYHLNSTPVDNSGQPTSNFIDHYNSFMDVWYPFYNSFAGFIYAVPSKNLTDPTFTTKQVVKNFTAQIAMAMKGTNWIESDIIVPPIVSEAGTTEISAFKDCLKNNPYSSLTKGKLENFNWGFEYDFEVGAESITLLDFTTTIENFFNSSASNLLKITLNQKGGQKIEIEGTVNCWFTNLITRTEALNLINAISYGANQVVSTISERNSITDVRIGHKVFVVETGELYSWNGTSWVFEVAITDLIGSFVQYGQQDIASSNIMTLDSKNEGFYITDQVNQIQKVVRSGFEEGQRVVIILDTGGSIKHNDIANGEERPLLLSSEKDFTAKNKIAIPFIWHDINGDNIPDVLLEEGGTSVALAVDDQFNVYAKPVQANGYQVATGGNITGWLINELSGCRVEQLGSATVSINSNSYINYSSGTLFGIKIYDSSDNLIHELACCENNVNVPYLHCSVGGRVLYITNVKTIVKQDIYFKCQENGWQRVTITESGDIMDVAYLNDKITKIYN